MVGRKTNKKQKEEKINESVNESVNETVNESANEIVNETETVVVKKRGRKPKGGKIISNTKNNIKSLELSTNIILHLKVKKKDIETINDSFDTNNINNISSYNINKELSYTELVNNNNNNTILNNTYLFEKNSNLDNNIHSNTNDITTHNINTNEVRNKLKELEIKLRNNNINDKKSNCFWCTYEFNNLPIYIPKFVLNQEYHVYGCFCSPECATAYLFKENINITTKYERYHLLNHLYSSIFKYEKNIKPAPNPFFTLDKYLGNLTIEEYRKILGNDNYFIMVEKPLTKVLPELYEENNNFLNNNINNTTNNYRFKRKNKI